jgi:ABC-type nitrate/sulfonate/bicarbonate transport system substrate-binding protein
MMGLYSALVKGFFAEEGLSVQGMGIDARTALEQGKPSQWHWVKTDQGLIETDFGFVTIFDLDTMAAGKGDYYIVDGMHVGCAAVMVPPDSPVQSAADLKGKTIAIPPWDAPYRGHMFHDQELKASGLDPTRDVTQVLIPWEAVPSLNDYVAEGFKTGKLAAVMVGEPLTLLLEEQKLARPLFTMNQAPYNQVYCCLLGIKKTIVESQPDKAARIVRAFRRAKQWTIDNPVKAVIAAKAAGYMPAAIPTEPSADRVIGMYGFDRQGQVDLEAMLEREFKERIAAGAIKTEKTPKELVRLVYRRLE